jgi:hypothetical protein
VEGAWTIVIEDCAGANHAHIAWMSVRDRPAKSLPSPVDLGTEGKATGKKVRVVIETARGARNKMAYDEELGMFRLKKVLPEGMTFPYDFGFVPSTLADDGDPQMRWSSWMSLRPWAMARKRTTGRGRASEHDR